MSSRGRFSENSWNAWRNAHRADEPGCLIVLNYEEKVVPLR